jgi:hypothetical protein
LWAGRSGTIPTARASACYDVGDAGLEAAEISTVVHNHQEVFAIAAATGISMAVTDQDTVPGKSI